jgi:hypothetical protein
MSDVVIALLEQSRAAHERSISVSRSWDASGKRWTVGDCQAASALLQEALTLREEAEALDPAHVSPAWAADRVPSAQLIAFYHAHLAIGASD